MTTTEHLACACALLTRRCAALRVERDDARGREEAQRLRVIDVENEQLNGDSALRKENAELIQNAVVANYNRDKALAKLAEAERRLAEGTAFTYCAYCGMKFAADGEHATDDVSQHICTCHKHPMRQVEAQRDAEKARADANKDAWYKCADRANAAEREVERLTRALDDSGRAGGAMTGKWEEARAEVERLRGMLLDAIRYVESEYGTRGELCGSAVNGQTYLEWVRATQREADAPTAPRPHICGDPNDPCDQDCVDHAHEADAPPADAPAEKKPRRMKANAKFGWGHEVEHDWRPACDVEPKCEPVDGGEAGT